MGTELGRRDDFLERLTGMWSHDASIGVYTTRLQLPGFNNVHYSLSCSILSWPARHQGANKLEGASLFWPGRATPRILP